MYLSPEPIRKVARGLEIGMICRDRLDNPTRALQAFKRVLELDPEQDEALAAVRRPARAARPVEGARRDARAHARGAGRAGRGQRPTRRRSTPTIAARWSSASRRRPPTSSAIRRARSAGGGARTMRRPTSRRSPTCAAPARPTGCGASSPRCSPTSASGWSRSERRACPSEPERFVALSRELARLCERRLGDKPRAHERDLREALAVVAARRQLLDRARAARRRARSAPDVEARARRIRRRRSRPPPPSRARRSLPAPRAHPRRARSTTPRARSPTCSPRSRGRPDREDVRDRAGASPQGARLERRRRGRRPR